MLIDAKGVAARLPHQGAMCLLDGVLRFTPESLEAVSNAHRRAAHPLHCDGGLPISSAIELAGQAAALHGRLLAENSSNSGGAPRTGRLAAVRGVSWTRASLRADDPRLLVAVELDAALPEGAAYRFRVSLENEVLISGRITVAAAH